jgi:hypothetical protein
VCNRKLFMSSARKSLLGKDLNLNGDIGNTAMEKKRAVVLILK